MKRIVVLSLCLAVAGCSAQSAPSNADQQKGGPVIELDGLKSQAPAGWEKQKPKSNLRKYQIRLPKVAGDPKDGELLIFHFGKGGGGGVAANLERWKGKFAPPRGKSIEDVASVSKFEAGAVPVIYLDVKGTYLYKFPPFAPNAKVQRLEDYRMFSVIFASDNGPYFITAIGPAKTMAHHKSGFDAWLKSFK